MSTINKTAFSRANEYLESVTVPNPQIQDECDLLSSYARELNPDNPNASTLSMSRKKELESRIDNLFDRIEKKLKPVAKLTPEQELEQQFALLKELTSKRGTLSAKDFHQEFKKLRSDVQKKVYEVVWIASGCPREVNFGKACLKKDTAILTQTFPPLTGGISGTIFQQVEADLRMDFELSKQQKNLNALKEIAADLKGNKPADQIKQKLLALDPLVQASIFDAVYKLGTGSSVDDAKLQVLANVNLLKNLKMNNVNGNNLIEQFAVVEKERLDSVFAPMTQNKVQFFREKFENIQNSKLQMKGLFNYMHPVVQQQLIGLGFQPPFYGRGFNPELYKTLGAHYNESTGKTTFRVYAPNAQKIELKLTAFKQVEHTIPMVKGTDGVWTVETKHAKPGRSYHFMVTGKDGGEPFKKVDPFAFQNIIHNKNVGQDDHESQVSEVDKQFNWTDGAWMSTRAKRNSQNTPLTIYEVHAPSWKKKQSGESLNWRELAPELAKYCKENNYNSLELMAMFAHPQAISMGYQITNFFAPNSDMGTWEDFQFFVDHMHANNINVFADWVPAHFALNDFALSEFDGSPLFEDDEKLYASHPTWGTKVFDFKKQFTRDFLTSNADFLLDKLHLDGLRVDAVASMLYMNYDRPNGNRRNYKGSEVDLEAKAYLRHFNAFVHKKHPGIVTMAEESSAFPNVTRPVGVKGQDIKTGGLGFDYTWHMGFMNDTLDFWKIPAEYRPSNFNKLLSTVEKVDGGRDIRQRGTQVLAYSHDESANGKGTIYAKMAGKTPEEKFANGRLALAYQMLRGGGPTLDFMGNETLQSDEWHGRLIDSIRDPLQKAKPSVNWEELDNRVNPFEAHFHRGAQASRRDLNHLYLTSPGLQDQTEEGFRWIHADSNNGVLSLHRRGGGQQFACIFNTSDKDFKEYEITLPDSTYAPELNRLVSAKEVYNTDDFNYGGKGRKNTNVEIIRDTTGRPIKLKLSIPPFSAIVLEEQFS